MPTGSEAYTIFDRGWIVRIQPAVETPSSRSLLLLHGWKGDEKVMWVFAHNLPRDSWYFAPRGPVQDEESGYGWLPHSGSLPPLADFEQPAHALMQAFLTWAKDTGAPVSPLDVMGFSQGAAMAYALAAYYPQQVHRIIALAGYLPVDAPMPGRYAALDGKRIYIAHGTRDETIPVQNAQEAVHILQTCGAQVTYCESDAGHKLSAGCLKGLSAFVRA